MSDSRRPPSEELSWERLELLEANGNERETKLCRTIRKLCDERDALHAHLQGETSKYSDTMSHLQDARFELTNQAATLKYVRADRDTARAQLSAYVTAAEGHEAKLADANAAADREMLRVKACEEIAEGNAGWEVLRNVCPSTAAVALLRDQLTIYVAAAEGRPASELIAPSEVERLKGLLSAVKALRGVILDAGVFTGRYVRVDIERDTWDALREAFK